MATTLPAGAKDANGMMNPGTQRVDNWSLEPTLIFLGLSAFAVYATYRAFSGFYDADMAQYLASNQTLLSGTDFFNFLGSPSMIQDVWYQIVGAPAGYKFQPFMIEFQKFMEFHHGYIARMGYAYREYGADFVSPFASPDLTPFLAPITIPITVLLQKFFNVNWLIISPALWILWVPGGFRLTCYYYRKAYYRSFFSAPSACGVSQTISPVAPFVNWLLGKGSNYKGEKVFPMVMQNLHRYFFYISALFILLLSWDAVVGFFFKSESGVLFRHLEDGKMVGFNFGIHIGSIVLTLNALLLGLYTFSCHSWRHLLGGMLDSFSACGAVGMMRNHAYNRQSKLNEHHMLFAWISLVWVGFTDFYIWMLAKGTWPDVDLLGPVMKLFGF